MFVTLFIHSFLLWLSEASWRKKGGRHRNRMEWSGWNQQTQWRTWKEKEGTSSCRCVRYKRPYEGNWLTDYKKCAKLIWPRLHCVSVSISVWSQLKPKSFGVFLREALLFETTLCSCVVIDDLTPHVWGDVSKFHILCAWQFAEMGKFGLSRLNPAVVIERIRKEGVKWRNNEREGDFQCPTVLPFPAAELQMSPLFSLFIVETCIISSKPAWPCDHH